MSLIETRSGGNATGLHGSMPFGVLSRRAAMLGSLGIAGLGISFGTPAVAHAAAVDAAPTASADFDLISLADRIVALNRRCEAVVEHQAALEDRVFKRCPAPIPAPKPPIFNFISETPTATGRILHIVQHHERDPAWVRWEETCAVAKAQHEQRKDEMAARLGLPEVRRRWARMDSRRDRWSANLAAMCPTTPAGLSAKASALQVLLGPDWTNQADGAERHAALLGAVLADAVRLGSRGAA